MILLVLFTLVVAYAVNFLYKKWKVYRLLLDNFKTPPRHPIFGTLTIFPKTAPEIFKTFQSLFGKYGKNFVLTRPILDAQIVISDAKDVEAILTNPNTKNARKAAGYQTLEPWLGTGLLTSYGEKWFTRRKIITPSFHFNILGDFVNVMSKQSDILIKHLKSMATKGEVDIYPIVNAFALDIISETAMGVTVNAQADPNSEYVTSVKKMSRAVQERLHHPLGQTGLYNLTSKGQYQKTLTTILHNFTDKVIGERRDQLLSNTKINKGSHMNFLDILLHASVGGKPLTNADIREEVDTFMFEGHDTTASGIAFTLYLLSRHTDVQEKVYQELKKVFGSKDEMEITKKKLIDLEYLEMVIKESLRILPPVPGIGRQLMEDTLIGGITVPAGVNLVLSIYRMQHDPDYYPNPEKFDPERFSSQSDNKRTFAYIPFSAGGRNCIGQKFALLDLKTVIAKVIMNFKLLPGPEVILQGDLILKTSNGIHIRFEQR
ncbi:probable cytochrome P450 4d14 [Hermetia illucens]|nr:probable cytochrome P450 4d14 [Hermetia illucens]